MGSCSLYRNSSGRENVVTSSITRKPWKLRFVVKIMSIVDVFFNLRLLAVPLWVVERQAICDAEIGRVKRS